MNNLSSYCGLVDAKIRASDKDWPVPRYFRFLVKLTKPFYDTDCYEVTGPIQLINVPPDLKDQWLRKGFFKFPTSFDKIFQLQEFRLSNCISSFV